MPNPAGLWLKIKIKETMIDIHIADDGNGFVKKQPSTGNIYRPGLGLTAMEERAHMLDGTMKVYSIIGIGTPAGVYDSHREKRHK